MDTDSTPTPRSATTHMLNMLANACTLTGLAMRPHIPRAAVDTPHEHFEAALKVEAAIASGYYNAYQGYLQGQTIMPPQRSWGEQQKVALTVVQNVGTAQINLITQHYHQHRAELDNDYPDIGSTPATKALWRYFNELVGCSHKTTTSLGQMLHDQSPLSDGPLSAEERSRLNGTFLRINAQMSLAKDEFDSTHKNDPVLRAVYDQGWLYLDNLFDRVAQHMLPSNPWRRPVLLSGSILATEEMFPTPDIITGALKPVSRVGLVLNELATITHTTLATLERGGMNKLLLDYAHDRLPDVPSSELTAPFALARDQLENILVEASEKILLPAIQKADGFTQIGLQQQKPNITPAASSHGRYIN
jgi:hypothetical protein